MGFEAPLALAPTSLPTVTLEGGSARTRERERERDRIDIGSIVGGRYQVAEFVAEGAFGAVYRADDIDVPGHVVALKLMHRPAASEAEHTRCLREVQLIAAVSHPSVVSFKDHGLHRGRLYIVMPWYEGETLAHRLETRGALTREQAVAIFRPLAAALAAMHERGIRHQDVKPENILLARLGADQADFPVLLDLGVGAFHDELLQAFTAAYVAPEMARAHLEVCAGNQPQPVDGKADVFALALTLFDALAPRARELSASAGSPDALARRSEHGAELPAVPELVDVMPAFARWLSVDPALRPEARELVPELALLTRAQERRAERRRLVMRLGPLLGAVLAIVALLALQLRQERVSSRVKDRRIVQQAAEIDQAREEIDALSGAQASREAAIEHSEKARELLEAQLARERTRKQQLERNLDAEQRSVRDLKRTLTDRDERTLELEHELRAIDQELVSIRQERDDLRAELVRASSARRVLANAHAESQREEERLNAELRASDAERERLVHRISELHQLTGELSTEIERLKEKARNQADPKAALDAIDQAEHAPATLF